LGNNLTTNYGTYNTQAQAPLAFGQPSSNVDYAAVANQLASAGLTGQQIANALSQLAPAPAPPRDHRNENFQCFEGTSPLCRFTSMQGETRQGANPRSFKVEVYDVATFQKRSLKLTVWPPAPAGSVPLHRIRALGDWWKRGLGEALDNIRVVTPLADAGTIPALPTSVDGFLERVYECLDHYPGEKVVSAWEAAHHYVVNQYVTKAGAPPWDHVWQLPVFQTALGPPQGGALGARPGGAKVAVSKYCVNWNTRTNTKCNPEPSDGCTKIHQCMVCDGAHRLADCPRRE
jgi:hypothetical protein